MKVWLANSKVSVRGERIDDWQYRSALRGCAGHNGCCNFHGFRAIPSSDFVFSLESHTFNPLYIQISRNQQRLGLDGVSRQHSSSTINFSSGNQSTRNILHRAPRQHVFKAFSEWRSEQGSLGFERMKRINELEDA